MSDITVREILSLIWKHKHETNVSFNNHEKDILYIVLSTAETRKSVNTEVYTAPDGSEVHLDIDSDGKIIGIEFY